LDVGENTNLPLPKELSSGILTKIVAWLRKVCKILKQILVEGEKNKKYNESLKVCDGTLRDGSLLLMSGNEFTTIHLI